MRARPKVRIPIGSTCYLHETRPRYASPKDTSCPECGKKMRGEIGLKDHMRTVHPNIGG